MSSDQQNDVILLFDTIEHPNWLINRDNRNNITSTKLSEGDLSELHHDMPDFVRPLLYSWITQWFESVQPALRRHSWHLQPMSTKDMHELNTTQRQQYIKLYMHNVQVSIDESILLQFVELSTLVFDQCATSTVFAEHSHRLHRVINEWNHIATVRQYCHLTSYGFELPICVRRVTLWLQQLYQSDNPIIRQTVQSSFMQDNTISRVWTVPTPKCCQPLRSKRHSTKSTQQTSSSSSSKPVIQDVQTLYDASDQL